MRVVVKKRSGNALAKLADWIDEQNTIGAGDRWLEEFYTHLESIGRSGVKYPICKNESLARYQYRCFTYKMKWVVAYKITSAKITIY